MRRADTAGAMRSRRSRSVTGRSRRDGERCFRSARWYRERSVWVLSLSWYLLRSPRACSAVLTERAAAESRPRRPCRKPAVPSADRRNLGGVCFGRYLFGRRLRQCVAKLLFLGIVKGCLEHGAASVLNLPQHLVRGHVLDEHEQRGIARLHTSRQFLHEGVIDAVIRQGAAERAGSRAERNTKDGIEKDHADQESPEAARHGAYGCRIDELVQLDRAGLRLHGNHGIADRDQILLLQLEQTLPHLFGLCFGWIDDRD